MVCNRVKYLTLVLMLTDFNSMSLEPDSYSETQPFYIIDWWAQPNHNLLLGHTCRTSRKSDSNHSIDTLFTKLFSRVQQSHDLRLVSTQCSWLTYDNSRYTHHCWVKTLDSFLHSNSQYGELLPRLPSFFHIYGLVDFVLNMSCN